MKEEIYIVVKDIKHENHVESDIVEVYPDMKTAEYWIDYLKRGIPEWESKWTRFRLYRCKIRESIEHEDD